MKNSTRLVLTAITFIATIILNTTLVRPVATTVTNKISVATVNGGDSAFLLNEAVQNGGTIWLVSLFLPICFVAIWWEPITQFFAKKSAKE